MAGGLLQLIAKGVDDLYIIGNPEITMFKIVYRRHTHFSKYDKESDIKCNKFSSKIKYKFENEVKIKESRQCQLQNLALRVRWRCNNR